jgi:hypothetical protein
LWQFIYGFLLGFTGLTDYSNDPEVVILSLVNNCGQVTVHMVVSILPASIRGYSDSMPAFDRFASRLRSAPVRENPQPLVGVKGSYIKKAKFLSGLQSTADRQNPRPLVGEVHSVVFNIPCGDLFATVLFPVLVSPDARHRLKAPVDAHCG